MLFGIKYITKEYSGFHAFLKLTNQKEILVERIMETISPGIDSSTRALFVYSDIGAGNGRVSIPVINFLAGRTKLQCHIIEPLKAIREFKRNCRHRQVTYYRNRIEEVALPASDFILASHVFDFIPDVTKILLKVFTSLNQGGYLLIIESDPESDDLQIKEAVRMIRTVAKYSTLVNKIIEYSMHKGWKLHSETVESAIDVSGCFPLSRDGRELVSYFYYRPFKTLVQKEIDLCLEEISKRKVKGGKLIKKERYIWIEK